MIKSVILEKFIKSGIGKLYPNSRVRRNVEILSTIVTALPQILGYSTPLLIHIFIQQ